MALLGMQDVGIAFGGPAVLDHARFAIERGERVCLLGRNGAGKSTVMKLLDGTIAPDTGAPAAVTSAAAGNVTFTPSRPLALPPPSMPAIATAASRSISITTIESALRPAGKVTSFTCSAKPGLATPSANSLPFATGTVALPPASVATVPAGELTLAPATNRPEVSITVTASDAFAGTGAGAGSLPPSPPPPPQAASSSNCISTPTTRPAKPERCDMFGSSFNGRRTLPDRLSRS